MWLGAFREHSPLLGGGEGGTAVRERQMRLRKIA